MDDTKWAILWGSWVAAFIVAETLAARSKNPQAPLSHQMRRVLGVRRRSVHHRLGQIAFASGTAWLAQHLYREVKS